MLSEYCVYTIRHSNELNATAEAGGTGRYIERKRWVAANQLLEDAKPQRKRLPIVFAPAEATDPLFGWALLENVAVDIKSTTYSFIGLRRFENPRPRKDTLKKRRDGKSLGKEFIRPYAICRTPRYLQEVEAAGAD